VWNDDLDVTVTGGVDQDLVAAWRYNPVYSTLYADILTTADADTRALGGDANWGTTASTIGSFNASLRVVCSQRQLLVLAGGW
jgi:hypothetical protein